MEEGGWEGGEGGGRGREDSGESSGVCFSRNKREINLSVAQNKNR